MVKHQRDLGNKPIMMQFGNWKDQHGKEMYVGCTIIVRSYAQMCSPKFRSGPVCEFAKGTTFKPEDIILDGKLSMVLLLIVIVFRMSKR
jgi:hypothetical protein